MLESACPRSGVKVPGPLRLIDASHATPRDLITAHSLRSQLDAIQSGEIVIVRTGWSRFFGTPQYAGHPFLDPAIAHAVLSVGASVVGVDCFSPDATDAAAGSLVPQPFHEVLLGSDGLIMENLTQLEKVCSGMLFVGMPLPLANGDGSPIRAIAIDNAGG